VFLRGELSKEQTISADVLKKVLFFYLQLEKRCSVIHRKAEKHWMEECIPLDKLFLLHISVHLSLCSNIM
jgi:hypothetical protein